VNIRNCIYENQNVGFNVRVVNNIFLLLDLIWSEFYWK
jgi:hypothetical protein